MSAAKPGTENAVLVTCGSARLYIILYRVSCKHGPPIDHTLRGRSIIYTGPSHSALPHSVTDHLGPATVTLSTYRRRTIRYDRDIFNGAFILLISSHLVSPEATQFAAAATNRSRQRDLIRFLIVTATAKWVASLLAATQFR